MYPVERYEHCVCMCAGVREMGSGFLSGNGRGAEMGGFWFCLLGGPGLMLSWVVLADAWSPPAPSYDCRLDSF